MYGRLKMPQPHRLRNRLLSCWPRDFDSLRVLDWIDGDGTTPTVGPTLTLAGTATARGGILPLRHRCNGGRGGVVRGTLFATNSNYRNTSALDPGAKDVIAIALLTPVEALSANVNIFTGNKATTLTAIGWRLGQSATAGQAIFSCHDGSDHSYGAISGSLVVGKTSLLIGVHDRDGPTTLYAAGPITAASNASATLCSTIDSGAGIGVNTGSAGTGDYSHTIHRIQVLYGTDLAGSWTAAYVASVQKEILGSGRTWVVGS